MICTYGPDSAYLLLWSPELFLIVYPIFVYRLGRNKINYKDCTFTYPFCVVL